MIIFVILLACYLVSTVYYMKELSLLVKETSSCANEYPLRNPIFMSAMVFEGLRMIAVVYLLMTAIPFSSFDAAGWFTPVLHVLSPLTTLVICIRAGWIGVAFLSIASVLFRTVITIRFIKERLLLKLFIILMTSFPETVLTIIYVVTI